MIFAHATTANGFAEPPVEALSHACVRKDTFAYNEFAELNVRGFWWTSTESGGSMAMAKRMSSSNDVGNGSYTDREGKANSLSIRCVED